MNSKYLTTREVAELLRIKERKVYDMAAEQLIPCTRATGKLLFSRVAIDQWLSSHSTGFEHEGQFATALFAGSHDPLLEWVIRESQCGIPTLFDGSIDGLQKVISGTASISAMHVYSSEQGRWNVPVLTQHLESAATRPSLALLSWVVRKRGLMVRPGLSLSGIQDVVGHKLVVRQASAGSQLLLEHLLEVEGLSMSKLNVALTARSEADVALAIAQGDAECGLGLESLALQHQLDFVPLIDESLDLLVDRRFWFEPAMQKFIEFCASEKFKAKVTALPGYSAKHLFRVLHNT